MKVLVHNDSAFSGIMITNILKDEDSVICAKFYENKLNKKTKNKIYSNKDGNYFIVKDKQRYYLNQFMKEEVDLNKFAGTRR
jgi:hypothetical protein